jgi:hypothetical protein
MRGKKEKNYGKQERRKDRNNGRNEQKRKVRKEGWKKDRSVRYKDTSEP